MAGSDEPVTVEQVMTSPVETIDAGARVTDAAKRLYDCRIGSLLVTEDGESVGIVTTTDISNYFPSHQFRSEPA
jgi:signal-transduction protein with cAMP-binding, CBS, and nucleotidyltransferase domain